MTRLFNPFALVFGVLALYAAGSVMAQTVPADLTMTNIGAAGLSSPIAVRSPNDGSGRTFIVTRGGSIRIFQNGALLPTPFLSISVCQSGEQGLLGLAFHPQFASNGKFYLQLSRFNAGSCTSPMADQVTMEYTVSGGDPNVADPNSAREILTVRDVASNHNGGDLHFGADGFLYISMGDGGPQNNPHGFAECQWWKTANNSPSTCLSSNPAGTGFAMLGKILRIDINGITDNPTTELCGNTAGNPARYRIPVDNPNVGTSSTCDEIYHSGLRNPFRFSFDRSNNDMIIGDVGQGTWEEVDLITNGSGPQNLGWSTCEGRQLFGSGTACNFGMLPILEYQHTGGRCSITGGYRYRGPITPLNGMFIYADYCSREVFFGLPDGGSASGFSATRWESAPGTPVLVPSNPIGFGEDAFGNLYVTGQGGSVYRFDSVSGNALLFANGFE